MATLPIRSTRTQPEPKLFGDLPPAVLQALESVALTNDFPTGAVLFSEG